MTPLPDMGRVGEAAHGLDPATAAIYFMAVLLVALLIERGLTGWRSGKTSHRLASAIDKMTEVIRSGDAQSMANLAVILHELTEGRSDRTHIKEELRKAREERKRIASALAEIKK